ncbi:MAG: antibiotic biosynthesis monooxygenase [Pseudomonadota bacterium]
MTVKAEKEQEFIRLAKQLTEATLKNEADTVLAYEFFKLKDEELGYAVFESFVSEAADEAHQKTSHFQEIAPALIECLDGTYVREYFEHLE